MPIYPGKTKQIPPSFLIRKKPMVSRETLEACMGYISLLLTCVLVAIVVIYALAQIGEPQSVWLVCDILSLCETTQQ